MKDKDPKDVTCCIVDSGVFLSWAFTLSRYYKRVLYTDLARRGSSKDLLIGDGFEGFERVTDPFEHFKDIDLWVFPNIRYGGFQEYLRSQGCLVWGSGYAEELELNRVQAKQLLRRLGLPVADYEKIRGLDRLRSYLKEHENKVVKLSSGGDMRDDMESWLHVRYELSESRLDELEHRLGPIKAIAIFLVEDIIDSEFEAGYDGFNIDGKFPLTAGFGFEIKDKAYVARVATGPEMPDFIREQNAALAPRFKKYSYRGWYANEVMRSDTDAYLIDLTMRSGLPSAEIYQQLYSNWGEIIYAGAQGDLVEPVFKERYGVQVMIASEWAYRFWSAIYFPDKIAEWIKLLSAIKIDGTVYCVPSPPTTAVMHMELGSVVGTGKTFDEATRKCKSYVEQLEGYQLEVKVDALDAAGEQIAKAKKYGVNF